MSTPPDDEDGAQIRARRNLFVASALAGLTAAAVACSSDPTPAPCLEPPAPGDASATPQPCLGMPLGDADVDASPGDASDATTDDDAARDAEPQPCLRMAPPDAGDD